MISPMTVEEIGKKLGVPRATVYKTLERAMRKLEKKTPHALALMTAYAEDLQSAREERSNVR
jgi:DNA-directed RNA polymerase specialized sigma24 family protein